MKSLKCVQQWLIVLLLSGVNFGVFAQTSQTASQTACLGNLVYKVDPIVGATFVWSVSGGVPANYQINGTGNNISVDWNTAGTYVLSVYSYSVISCQSPTKSVTVTVENQPVGPTINVKTPNLASVCEGANVSATFNAGSGGVGCSDVFEYRFDGGLWVAYTAGTNLNTTAHTSVEIQGQRSGCTADAGCSGTSWVTLASWTVNPSVVVSVTNAASQNNLCGTAAVTFTATPTNGGASPVYAWYVNGIVQVGTTASFSYSPLNSDAVYATLTSNASCATGSPATSNVETIIVNTVPSTSDILHN